MKHIITINREFGSGGREVGKRLAELRGIAYYDNEIITKIAERNSLAEDYVQSIIEQKPIRYYPIMIGRSFYTMPDPFFVQSAKIYEEQYQIISELARKSDCVIIGRCADYILREYQTVNIFVYADISSRIRRCQQKSPIEEHLTEQELTRKII
ncbi:MAG: cytidylate kinase-like family protein, partial [Clostridiales bacterium]